MPPHVPEVVVAEIAERVGGDEPQEQQQEGPQVEAPVGRREEPGDHGRLGGDDEDHAAGGKQELRHRIQGAEGLPLRRVEAHEGPEPHARSPHDVPVHGRPS